MKWKFFRSLYWKLAVTFGVLISLAGAVQLLVVFPRAKHLVEQIDQRTYWNIASDVAEIIQPMIDQGVGRAGLEKKLFELYLMNPKVALYILDKSGNPLAGVNPIEGAQLQRIRTEHIERALKVTAPSLPLYGPDPSEGLDEKKVFSVAPLRIGRQEGYLYLVFGSKQYDFNLRSVGEAFIVENVVGGVFVITVMSAVLGAVLFRYLTSSFRALTATVKKYESGDFSPRIEVRGDDEVADLSSAVNHMAHKIEENAIQRAQLIAGITHDLKTPLTSVKGFSEMVMQNPNISREQLVEYMQSIYINSEYQQRMIDDLFELSKMQLKEKSPQQESFVIQELIDEVVVSQRFAAQERSISLSLDLGQEPLWVAADRQMIERVLANLCSNAIRYSDVGGEVTMQIAKQSGRVFIEIKDSGIGIAQEEIEKIFDPLYRAAQDRSKKTGGSGIGLAVVKTILELHSSEIKVESEKGKGSKFSFSLPLLPRPG